MPDVKNVTRPIASGQKDAGKLYEELTGRPVPEGMVAAHVTMPGHGNEQFLVPATREQNDYRNTNIYKVRHKPVSINGRN